MEYDVSFTGCKKVYRLFLENFWENFYGNLYFVWTKLFRACWSSPSILLTSNVWLKSTRSVKLSVVWRVLDDFRFNRFGSHVLFAFICFVFLYVSTLWKLEIILPQYVHEPNMLHLKMRDQNKCWYLLLI